MRRALEYTIHDRELQDTKKKLSEMENKRKNSGEEAERLRNALQDAQDAAKAASKDVKDFKVKEAAAKEELGTLNAEQQQQTKEITRLQFQIKVGPGRRILQEQFFLTICRGCKNNKISSIKRVRFLV